LRPRKQAAFGAAVLPSMPMGVKQRLARDAPDHEQEKPSRRTRWGGSRAAARSELMTGLLTPDEVADRLRCSRKTVDEEDNG
jgi:hypothetical protein